MRVRRCRVGEAGQDSLASIFNIDTVIFYQESDEDEIDAQIEQLKNIDLASTAAMLGPGGLFSGQDGYVSLGQGVNAGHQLYWHGVGAAEHGLGVSGAKVLTTVCRYGRRNGQNSGVSKAHWT